MTETARPRRRRSGVQFRGEVTLGNILALIPLLGILGTALVTLWTMSAEMQRTQDQIAASQTAIAHEAALREAMSQSFQAQITALREDLRSRR